MIHVYAYSVMGQMQVRVTCAEPVQEPEGLKLLYGITGTGPASGAPAGSSEELFNLAQCIFDCAAELHATEHSR